MEKIQIVLASPSDLSEERQMIRELVNSLNSVYMKYGICFDLRMWENVAPGMDADGPQGVIDIDLEIPQADIFICLYWKRIGTVIANENIAGSELELNLALVSYLKRRKPDIKAFFNSYHESEKNSDTEKIEEIAKRLQPLGLYSSFDNIDSLRKTVNIVLQSAVMKQLQNMKVITPNIHKYVEVSNTEELIANLVSNRKLVLNKGYYDILDFQENTSNAAKQEVFDGTELIVSKVSDITVVGDSSILLVSPRYATVINFHNCSNIKLIGLTFGHTPKKGSCAGAVLRFENCQNIQLDALDLFGCGTYGIELINCTNVRANGIKIYECTNGALNIINSNIELTNSMIYDCNKILGCLIEAVDSQLDFNNVSIFHNYIENYLISLTESTFFCDGVCIYGNSFAALCNEEIKWGVFLENNIIENDEKYYVTISSVQPCEIEQYQKYKVLASDYGKIHESIFEEGKFSISLNCTNYKQYEIFSSIISSDNKVKLVCG